MESTSEKARTGASLEIDDDRVVSFHYRLGNGFGELVDSSLGGLPFVYMHNSGSLLPSLEREFTGRRAGDGFEVVIYPEDGYGYADEERVATVPRERFKEIGELHVGMRVRMQAGESTELVTVREIDDDEIMVDANHPLAGQVLHFEISIVDVREPTEVERAQGFASTTNPPGSAGSGVI